MRPWDKEVYNNINNNNSIINNKYHQILESGSKHEIASKNLHFWGYLFLISRKIYVLSLLGKNDEKHIFKKRKKEISSHANLFPASIELVTSHLWRGRVMLASLQRASWIWNCRMWATKYLMLSSENYSFKWTQMPLLLKPCF